MRMRIAVLLALAGSGAAAAAEQPRGPGFEDSTLVTAWNDLVNRTAFAEDQFFTFKGVRAHAMMHIAMHDALNAVVPLYRQYAFHGRESSADPVAAAAQAAHDVVVYQYPGEKAALDAELARWLSATPDGPRKNRGTALGNQSAAAILAMRAGDGWDYQGSYTFLSGPGYYQTTPPFAGFIFQPGFRFARPFGLLAPDQFRPLPPPTLTGSDYTQAYNEVKDSGSVASAVRTAEQTAYAIWWMEFTDGSMNRLGRQLVNDRKVHLWQAARLFALLNMTMFDGYVANFDSKYAFNHWRPYTAIREGATDGNPATVPDPNWEPLRTTPPHPEYVSAHSTVCATSFAIFADAFGKATPFVMQTTTAPPGMPVRWFPSFTAAADECADSRVRLGWHFRYSTNRGLELGRAVAGWLLENHLQLAPGASGAR